MVVLLYIQVKVFPSFIRVLFMVVIFIIFIKNMGLKDMGFKTKSPYRQSITYLLVWYDTVSVNFIEKGHTNTVMEVRQSK